MSGKRRDKKLGRHLLRAYHRAAAEALDRMLADGLPGYDAAADPDLTDGDRAMLAAGAGVEEVRAVMARSPRLLQAMARLTVRAQWQGMTQAMQRIAGYSRPRAEERAARAFAATADDREKVGDLADIHLVRAARELLAELGNEADGKES
jgi:hypothetical protein